jgi:hypothetical protein
MIYKSVSSKAVIAKVFRDLKPTTDTWVIDAVEWIGEALEFIGYIGGLERKALTLKVKNHRALLPCELVDILQVEYQGSALPYGTDTTGFDLPNAKRTTSPSPYSPGSITTAAVFKTKANEHPSGADTFKEQKEVTSSGYGGGDYYVINPDYLQTSFEKGDVKVHFSSYPICKDGFPKVPDNIYYKQALEWYVIRQMLMGGYSHPFINWQVADQKWGHYCVAAQNDAAYPSIDKMESFKNMWVRMIPNINAHSDFFMGNNTQERLAR